MDATIDIKIVFIGAVSVGKTCLIRRYCHNIFDDETKSTVGAAFVSHAKSINSYSLNLMIWDPSGSERFHSVMPMVLRGVEIIVLVFDMSDPSTLLALEDHLKAVEQAVDMRDLPVVLLGNKCDLKIHTSMDEIRGWMDAHSLRNFVRVSAKTGDGVEKMLDGVLLEFLSNSTTAREQEILRLRPQTPTRGCPC